MADTKLPRSFPTHMHPFTLYSSSRLRLLGLTVTVAACAFACGRDQGPRPGVQSAADIPARQTGDGDRANTGGSASGGGGQANTGGSSGGTGAGAAAPDGPAQNIIIIIGDGMGPAHVELGRRFRDGGGPLHMDGLDEHTRMTTLAAGDVVTDSAASATAIATGQRTSNSRIGMSSDGENLHSIFDDARTLGKRMGLVTTSYVHDATPAAFSTHALSRSDYASIIQQLAGEQRVDVLLGGGALAWEQSGALAALSDEDFLVVRDAAQLNELEHPQDRPLVGLFTASVGQHEDPIVQSVATSLSTTYLTFARERPAEATDPTLPEMLRFALDELGSHEEGFIVMAENELTDELSHQMGASSTYVSALLPVLAEEVLRVDETVQVAVDWIAEQPHPERTLLIVTADHETCGLDLGAGSSSADALAHATCVSSSHTDRVVDVWGSGADVDLDAVQRNADLYAVMAAAWGVTPG